MKLFRRVFLTGLLCTAAFAATTGDVMAQRGARIIRGVVSPWYDFAPPLGRAGNSPWENRYYYYPNNPTYVQPVAPVTVTAPAAIGSSAEIRINVPQHAEVFVNGNRVGQQGTDIRVFRTPPLELGWAYTYRVTSRWHDGRGIVSQDRNVSVTAGEQQTVDFRGDFVSTPQAPAYR